jgi:hypothetical protein
MFSNESGKVTEITWARLDLTSTCA